MDAEGLKIEKAKLPEVWIIRLIPDVDFRGSYSIFFTEELFYELTGEHIAEGNLVDNYLGVFRGYHYSPHSWKLYLCLRGALHYFLVNWDKLDPEYGRWQEISLLPDYGFIKHPRYATAMWSVGTENSQLMVLQSQHYNPDKPDQQTIERNQLNAELIAMNKRPIFYPDLPVIMSERDMVGEYESRR